MTKPDPIEGRWYWIRVETWLGENEDPWWFPALRDLKAAGGWTNTDCWEDYDGRVREWKLIPNPDEPF